MKPGTYNVQKFDDESVMITCKGELSCGASIVMRDRFDASIKAIERTHKPANGVGYSLDTACNVTAKASE